MPVDDLPDPGQGSPAGLRDWPSTSYLDEMWAFRVKEPSMESSCVIGLFGDCTVAGQGGLASHHHLGVRLRRAFPGQPCVIRNLAADGETVSGFLSRIDTVLAELPRLDIAFIRCGINDRKEHGIDGCIRSLDALCRTLKAAHPAVAMFIETGI